MFDGRLLAENGATMHGKGNKGNIPFRIQQRSVIARRQEKSGKIKNE